MRCQGATHVFINARCMCRKHYQASGQCDTMLNYHVIPYGWSFCYCGATTTDDLAGATGGSR